MATATEDEQPEVDVYAAAQTAIIAVTALAAGVFLGLEIAAKPAAITLQMEHPELFQAVQQIHSVTFWAAVSGLVALVGLLFLAE